MVGKKIKENLVYALVALTCGSIAVDSFLSAGAKPDRANFRDGSKREIVMDSKKEIYLQPDGNYRDVTLKNASCLKDVNQDGIKDLVVALETPIYGLESNQVLYGQEEGGFKSLYELKREAIDKYGKLEKNLQSKKDSILNTIREQYQEQ